MTAAQKATIDGMDRYSLARMWRFAKVGESLLQGETGDYFKERFFGDLGGFTPEISKALGSD